MIDPIWPWADSHQSSDWPWLHDVSTSGSLAKGEDYHFTQTHEMLFDSHAGGFAVCEGVAKRCIYDNMRTAVDKVGQGKERIVNARFEAMTGHYLFEHEFCNRAAGWEKGIVEKNVQDRRRGVLREAAKRHWASLEELNEWLQTACNTSGGGAVQTRGDSYR